MTIFTECHATLLAMWISERNAEKWRANIGAPIGACHETTPCVGRNQEVPVEQIIISWVRKIRIFEGNWIRTRFVLSEVKLIRS